MAAVRLGGSPGTPYTERVADPRTFVFLVTAVALFLGAIGAGPAMIVLGVIVAAAASRVLFPESGDATGAEAADEEPTRR